MKPDLPEVDIGESHVLEADCIEVDIGKLAVDEGDILPFAVQDCDVYCLCAMGRDIGQYRIAAFDVRVLPEVGISFTCACKLRADLPCVSNGLSGCATCCQSLRTSCAQVQEIR